MRKSCGCDQVLSGLLFASFCTFISQMIVVICSEHSIKPENIESKIFAGNISDEYLLNFNDNEMKCIEEFFKYVDKEKK